MKPWRLRKAAGLTWWSGKVPGADDSQFVCYCPFNPNVILPCVGEQGSIEEGDRADMAVTVRGSWGADESQFLC
jgi:hypothetical protein